MRLFEVFQHAIRKYRCYIGSVIMNDNREESQFIMVNQDNKYHFLPYYDIFKITTDLSLSQQGLWKELKFILSFVFLKF